MSITAPRTLDIFNAALEIVDPEQRAAYLVQACRGDVQLRANITELLHAYHRGAEKLNQLLPARGISFIGGIETKAILIDRYTLLEKIGEGGCGVVYVAEPKEDIRRRVALKIIKAGMDTESVIARFEAERQALAMMDHPNIARVFDAGTSASGRPYFVMELVEGVRITDFCSQNQLSIRERLSLFVQVCHGVQHAHQKGIIHRDLKPSNILVKALAPASAETLSRPPSGLNPEPNGDGDPIPKIIDFGIAKAVAGRLTDHTIHTGLHQFIGTPAYMSPEQADLNPDIDIRTDIYSLGVLLYELLAGKPPFENQELLTVGLDEMRRIIREREPMRPSQWVPSQIKDQDSSIDADLDCIVLKSLEKDRSHRYETAIALAADVERYLRDEPVLARPASAAYRLQKLVRRHRTASVAVACVLLVVVIGTALSTWAFLRERSARVREQAALYQANDRLRAALAYVDQVLTKVAPKIRLLAGAGEAQDNLLEANLSFVQRLRETAGDDPAARIALVHLLLETSERQNPGEPNTSGNYEAALKRAEEASHLLRWRTLTLPETERLPLLFQARFATIQSLYGLGRFEEGILRSRETEGVLDQMERIPEHERRARRHRMLLRYNAGWATYLAGRPSDSLTNHILPLLSSDWSRALTEDSPEDELHILANAHDLASNAYAHLKNYQAMLPHAKKALHLAELLAARPGDNVFYADMILQCRAWHGLALLLTGDIDRGQAELAKARKDIEARLSKQQASESFRRHHVIITAVQALAFAGWSQDLSAAPAERRQRLTKAEAYLAEAEEFSKTIKSKTGALPAARTEIAAAQALLRSGPQP